MVCYAMLLYGNEERNWLLFQKVAWPRLSTTLATWPSPTCSNSLSQHFGHQFGTHACFLSLVVVVGCCVRRGKENEATTCRLRSDWDSSDRHLFVCLFVHRTVPCRQVPSTCTTLRGVWNSENVHKTETVCSPSQRSRLVPVPRYGKTKKRN